MFKVGDLVKWYETYGDVFITKNAGIGVVVEQVEHDYGFNGGPYVIYKIFRNKHKDFLWCEKCQLEAV